MTAEVVDDAKGGKGLRAMRRLAAGDVVLTERSARVLAAPTKYTIERAPREHLECATELRFTNHSFEPNCAIRFDPEDAVSLVAVEAIEIGDELTIDYHATESSMAEPFLDAATGAPVRGSSLVDS
mmetsp:Transcript_14023/g.42411  ORF Transcript_14023/g.42411 Transcript_14023/m.42411 type:complete len:126 (-) Transcript_14023:172-549(-)